MTRADARLPWHGRPIDGRFAGRRALVTGAASGIGAAVAARLVDEGAGVAGLDRAWDGQADDPGLTVRLTADVRDAEAVEAAIRATVEVLGGPPDVLVNAAGVHGARPLLETTLAEWDEVLAINLRGTFLVAAAAVRAGLGPGVIVNLSSVAAYAGNAVSLPGAFSSSKAAVSGLTRQMAVEWAERGIRVVAVAPGIIDTPTGRLLDDGAGGRASVTASVPLRRLGTVAEVAAIVCFVASAEAAYLTGTAIVVDGGLLAR